MSANKKPAPAPKDEGPTVEAVVLARLFGLTPTRISQLGKNGTLPKARERGKYLLWPSVKNYIAALKNPKVNGHSTADGTELPEGIRTRKERKIDLECQKIEHQLEVQKGKYMLKSDAVEAASVAALASKTAWEGLEDEIPPMLEGLTAAKMKVKLRDYGRMKSNELAEIFEEL